MGQLNFPEKEQIQTLLDVNSIEGGQNYQITYVKYLLGYCYQSSDKKAAMQYLEDSLKLDPEYEPAIDLLKQLKEEEKGLVRKFKKIFK